MHQLADALVQLEKTRKELIVVDFRPFGYLADGDEVSLIRYTTGLEFLKTLLPGSYVVILTAGYEPNSPSTPTEKRPVSLADECKKFLVENGIPESAIIVDPCAWGTLSETEKIVRIMDRENINPLSIYDITDFDHSVRAKQTWNIAANLKPRVHMVKAPRCMPKRSRRREIIARFGYRCFVNKPFWIPRVRQQLRHINRKYASY